MLRMTERRKPRWAEHSTTTTSPHSTTTASPHSTTTSSPHSTTTTSPHSTTTTSHLTAITSFRQNYSRKFYFLLSVLVLASNMSLTNCKLPSQIVVKIAENVNHNDNTTTTTTTTTTTITTTTTMNLINTNNDSLENSNLLKHRGTTTTTTSAPSTSTVQLMSTLTTQPPPPSRLPTPEPDSTRPPPTTTPALTTDTPLPQPTTKSPEVVASSTSTPTKSCEVCALGDSNSTNTSETVTAAPFSGSSTVVSMNTTIPAETKMTTIVVTTIGSPPPSATLPLTPTSSSSPPPPPTTPIPSTIQLTTTTAASIVNDYSLSFKIDHEYRSEMSVINSTEYLQVLAKFEDGLMTSCREVLKETFKGIDRNYRLSQGSVKIESVLSVFGNDTSLVEDKTAWENSLSSTLPGLFINGTFDIKKYNNGTTTPAVPQMNYVAVGVSCGILFALGIILFIILLCLYLHRKKLKDQKDIPKSECEIYVNSITGPNDQKGSKRLWMHNNSTGFYKSTDCVGGDVSTAAANGAATGKSTALERIDEGGPHAPTSDSDSDYDGDQSDPVPLHRRQKDDVIVNLTAQSLNGKTENERPNKKWDQSERASHARDNPAFERNPDDSLDNILSYRPHTLSQPITECTESTAALEDVSVALSSDHKQQAPRVNLVKPYNRDNDVDDNRNYYSQFRKPTDNSSQHVEAPAHINPTTKQSQQRPANPTMRNEMDLYRKNLFKPVDFGGPCIPGSNTSLQNNSSIGSRLSHAEPSAPDIDLKQVSPLDELFSNNKEQSFKSTLTAKARKLLGKNSNDILYRTNGNA